MDNESSEAWILFLPTSPLKMEGRDESCNDETPNLDNIPRWEDPKSSLVNRSASWFFERVNWRDMRLEMYSWRKKWQSSSTCLFLSWKTGLWAIWIAAWLSEWTGTDNEGEMARSSSKRTNQVISTVTFLINRYSASAEEREIEACFFDFHEIGEPPRVMKKLLIDLRVSLQDSQSTSQKAKSAKEGSDDKRIPSPGYNYKYFNTQSAAEKWERQGLCMNWLSFNTRNAKSLRVWVR